MPTHSHTIKDDTPEHDDPEVDWAKVARLRAEIADGRYRVSPRALAHAILERLQA